ncbi:MAG: hypothetical protein ACAH11_05580 [Sphingomonas sp.]
MVLLSLLPLAAIIAAEAPAVRELPRPAPARFVSTDYALTFRTPAGSTYCPLPADFVGSYHGTTFFLTPQRQCGYAIGARISVGYGLWFSPAEMPRDPCNQAGTIRVFGKDRPLCRREESGMIVLEASARYSSKGARRAGEREAYVSLVTTPERLEADLARLRATAASLSVCRSVVHSNYEDGSPAKPYVTGYGPPCPPSVPL